MDTKGSLSMIALTSTVFKGGEEQYFKLSVAASGPYDVLTNIPNIGMVPAYHKLYRMHRAEHDILVFLHDDVELMDPFWATQVQNVFDTDPKVAIVGLGGATGIGVPDIYKVPYQINQLQRIDYYSNQIGWEIHGKRETGVRDVCVVDGFFMAVRTEFLDQVNGWSWFPHRFHLYDIALCLKAIRAGWKVKMIGLEVDHHGGGTSTKAEYFQYCKDAGTTPEREHWEPHVWMHEEFRDLLPLRIK